MNKPVKIAIVIALVGAVGLVVAIKGSKPGGPSSPPGALPRLVDLGSTTCIPCKMMAPILEELKQEYAGKLLVEFIDVGENPDAGKPYGIKLIPTQVFFDASGKELWRHEGFIAKEDILAKWKELGVDLATGAGGGQEPGTVAPPVDVPSGST
jgi:thioredoxin 1